MSDAASARASAVKSAIVCGELESNHQTIATISTSARLLARSGDSPMLLLLAGSCSAHLERVIRYGGSTRETLSTRKEASVLD